MMRNTSEDKQQCLQSLPRTIEHLAIVLVVAVALGLVACGGGGGGGGFDPFQGRPATVEDLEGRTFTFAFAANGGPFDPSLGDRPTTVGFGAFDAMSTAPFTLEVGDGAVAGLATFNDSLLRLTFSDIDPSLPFAPGQEVALDVLADIDDGRISVRNIETGLEATSGPGSPTPTLRPGDTFLLGMTETITISGTYGLPAGATSITYRGTGHITVEIPTSPPQINTCFCDGSTSFTNNVTGVSEVTYTFGAGASARVTVGVLF